MTRDRARRSFTVAAKSSGQQGFVSIPAKAPRLPQAALHRSAPRDPWASSAEAAALPSAVPAPAPEPRRILPNLIAWEAPAPEPEPEILPEPPLPRVRRAAPQGAADEAPRRRGRPRKHPLPAQAAPAVIRVPDPVPAAARIEPVRAQPTPVVVQRKERPESASLRLGERWKRRLPRSCW